MKVLIAGGSGLIGRALVKQLESEGHTVGVLSRNPKDPKHIAWNPAKGEVDTQALADVEVLIHLSGAGIADKAWSKKRKEELLRSRVEPIRCLWEHRDKMTNLKQSIAISGVNCYGLEDREKPYTENEAYGSGFIDQLVREWEEAAMLFAGHVPVCILRTGVVLSDDGGAVKRLVQPLRYGLGAVLGNGKQWMPWVHSEDVARAFAFMIEGHREGTYNLVAGNVSNRELTQLLARKMSKRLWLPPVPGIFMKMMFGQMAELLLKGVKISNEQLRSTGFEFRYSRIEDAVDSLRLK